MDDEMIKFKGVKKRFGNNLVLDNVSFTIPEGKITGIIGASGEGKTTILKVLVGFHKPTEGEVFYSKRNIFKDMENIKSIFGFATEDGSFHDRLTVLENIMHFGTLHKVNRKDLVSRADELMELVGIRYARNTLAQDLSMGMKKRLDVAISLVHNPQVLILDEPTADLDPLLRDSMLRLIKRINELGTTIILTTQLMGEMDRVCDRVAVLFNKKIIEEGNPKQIKAKYHSTNLNDVFNKIFSRRKKFEDETETVKKENVKKVVQKKE